VKVPPGTGDGRKIRLKGEGLRLKVNVARDPRFEVQGSDMTTTVKITPPEAVLGAKVEVPTLDGQTTVTIPPGTSSGVKLRLKGRGMHKNKNKERGDLFVRPMIAVPKQPSDEEKKLYEQLKENSAFNPRTSKQ
jgi:DnaJ-class molecular chaperone